jgi:hypothetical protein
VSLILPLLLESEKRSSRVGSEPSGMKNCIEGGAWANDAAAIDKVISITAAKCL